MAVRAGEELAVTVYADVHYLYSDPRIQPVHHRFDKGSYVYVYENATQRRARLEIANRAGTPDQDAFTGYLDAVEVSYAYSHTNRVTLDVDVHPPNHQPVTPADHDWHLPAFDLRNEQKYLYKLRSLDLYFRSRSDALKFLGAIRRVLPAHQTKIEGEPEPVSPHHQGIPSPVVQQLENASLADPRISRQSSLVSQLSQAPLHPSSSRTAVLPGPPPGMPKAMPPPPAHSQSDNLVPMAYNPAAPAAPEVIRHREKTPPPEDGAVNPLMAAAASDHVPYGSQTAAHSSFPPQAAPHALYSGITSPPPQQTNFAALATSPPPKASAFQLGLPASQASPVAHQALQQSSYFVGATPAAPHDRYAQTFAATPSFAAPPISATVAPPSHSNMTTPAFSPPGHNTPAPAPAPMSNSFAFANPVPVPPSTSSPSPIATDGSSGQINTGIHSPQAPPPHTPLNGDYRVHQQAYQPTQEELVSKNSKQGKKAERRKDDGPRGRLEDNAAKVENKVGGFLKKFEKKYL